MKHKFIFKKRKNINKFIIVPCIIIIICPIIIYAILSGITPEKYPSKTADILIKLNSIEFYAINKNLDKESNTNPNTESTIRDDEFQWDYEHSIEPPSTELNIELVTEVNSEPSTESSTETFTEPSAEPNTGNNSSNQEKSKVMYLTFDDGPSEKITPLILDILKEKNVKATFFVVGEYVLKYPDIMRRIVEEGHAIGLHSHTHVMKDIYASADNFIEDLNKVYDAVFQTTGVESKLYRFPGGSISNHTKNTFLDIKNALDERGFVYFDWNASVEDAVAKPVASLIVENAIATSGNKNTVVMLAHDRVLQTAEALGDIIEALSKIYKMEILTPEVNPVQFRY